ncbi:MAG: radical SAM protein [Candidatus Heimdallarchaeota archaeon]|nr:radical SAM protein [Candidatus Heimdallarchaeota archaeon]
MTNFSDIKNQITINLQELIPFDLKMSPEKDRLLITKGVMSSEISLASIELDLQKRFSIVNNKIDFLTQPIGSIILDFTLESSIDIEEVNSFLQQIVSSELPLKLKNNVTKKPLTYIPDNYFGIPLIGSIYFGVIDRGTSLLQLRPITGCPLNCPFCSVDEGPSSKTKLRDFIIDSDYLANTYNYVVKEKGLKEAEAHLDGQGEPMSYPYLPELVQKLWLNKSTKIVSIQTNGWFLTEKLIDELAEVKLSRINLSLNASELNLAKHLAGRGDYPLEKILEMAEYIVNSGVSLLIAPIWIPEINDVDIEKIVEFSCRINSKQKQYPTMGIQNYLVHNEGRNIKGIKQKSFNEFYEQLRSFEEKYNVQNLVLKQFMFKTKKSKMIPNPMKINEIVIGEVVLQGRLEGEVIAQAKNRLIHVSNASNLSVGKKVKLRITRNRHNIFFATPI